MTKKILVTGAAGQLGQALQALSRQYPSFTFIFTDRQQLDITQEALVSAFFEEHQPDICINCAAYTAVDQAESKTEQAFLLNDQAVGFLAKACRQGKGRLLHVSSDYVYHNQLNRPLRESDPCTPKSVYAQSKLAGDLRALKENPNTYILRTSWVYGNQGHNFVKTMLRLGKERERLSVVYDQIGAPTYAPDIARALLGLAEQPETNRGIYHFANSGVTSWYDFARAIFEIKAINCQVHPIPSSDYPTAAARPHYSLLDTRKIQALLSFEIPHWRERLVQCLSEM